MTLPPDFISRMQALLGDSYALFEKALDSPPPVSIRMNLSKRAGTIGKSMVGWCAAGRYLQERPAFTFDPLFHAGIYYVQEASSMFLGQAIKAYVKEPVRCLDLCAAPGGKSTHLLDSLPAGSLLVSNEVIRNRSQVLSENITKWGNPSSIVTNNDPKQIGQLHHFFDILVADLPCSGEGMFRKDPESISEWSTESITHCAARGRRIIHDAWDALKPGGLLLYSTCTYNIEENEENISYLIRETGAEPLPIVVDQAWGISGALRYDFPVYRFFPHRTAGEGFFLALLRKPYDKEEPFAEKNKRKKTDKHQPIPSEICHWLSHPDDFHIEATGNLIHAFPASHLDDYRKVAEQLRIVSSGVWLGEIKGKDLLPAHALAMSTAFNQSAFEQVEIPWPTAIRYLRKEALVLPDNIGKGYVVPTYKGFPLGFVKQLGNRANNLYPSEWRIRSGYIPDENSQVLFST